MPEGSSYPYTSRGERGPRADSSQRPRRYQSLFLDFGYLRKRSDRRHRFGAGYTIGHVSGGADFLRHYMRGLGYDTSLARLASTLPPEVQPYPRDLVRIQ